jgi:hypothetical protein
LFLFNRLEMQALTKSTPAPTGNPVDSSFHGNGESVTVGMFEENTAFGLRNYKKFNGLTKVDTEIAPLSRERSEAK